MTDDEFDELAARRNESLFGDPATHADLAARLFTTESPATGIDDESRHRPVIDPGEPDEGPYCDADGEHWPCEEIRDA